MASQKPRKLLTTVGIVLTDLLRAQSESFAKEKYLEHGKTYRLPADSRSFHLFNITSEIVTNCLIYGTK